MPRTGGSAATWRSWRCWSAARWRCCPARWRPRRGCGRSCCCSSGWTLRTWNRWDAPWRVQCVWVSAWGLNADLLEPAVAINRGGGGGGRGGVFWAGQRCRAGGRGHGALQGRCQDCNGAAPGLELEQDQPRSHALRLCSGLQQGHGSSLVSRLMILLPSPEHPSGTACTPAGHGLPAVRPRRQRRHARHCSPPRPGFGPPAPLRRACQVRAPGARRRCAGAAAHGAGGAPPAVRARPRGAQRARWTCGRRRHVTLATAASRRAPIGVGP